MVRTTKLLFDYKGPPSENIAKSFRVLLFDSHCSCHNYYLVWFTVLTHHTKEEVLLISVHKCSIKIKWRFFVPNIISIKQEWLELFEKCNRGPMYKCNNVLVGHLHACEV